MLLHKYWTGRMYKKITNEKIKNQMVTTTAMVCES